MFEDTYPVNRLAVDDIVDAFDAGEGLHGVYPFTPEGIMLVKKGQYFWMGCGLD